MTAITAVLTGVLALLLVGVGLVLLCLLARQAHSIYGRRRALNMLLAPDWLQHFEDELDRYIREDSLHTRNFEEKS